MSDDPAASAQPEFRKIPLWLWVLGFLCFPAGVFVCLRCARVISSKAMVLGVIGSVALYFGITGIVNGTRDLKLQALAELLMSVMFYLIGIWLYTQGERLNYWSEGETKAWRVAGRLLGWFFAVILLLYLIAINMLLRLPSPS